MKYINYRVVETLEHLIVSDETDIDKWESEFMRSYMKGTIDARKFILRMLLQETVIDIDK